MDRLRLLLIEDSKTRRDRHGFLCSEDSRWYDRPGYLLNKMLLYLSDSIHVSSILDSEIPGHVPDNVDILMVHIDNTVLDPKMVEWMRQAAGNRPIVNGKLVDISKRTTDENRPPGMPSLLLPPETRSGSAFVKSNYNSGDALEKLNRRVNVQDIDPGLIERPDLVLQHWVQDYRAEESGVHVVERLHYILGDLTVQETMSDQPISRRGPLWTMARPRTRLLRDISILKSVDLPVGPIAVYWLADQQYWGARWSVVQHYARQLFVDFAALDVIEQEQGSVVVLDINKTPFSVPLGIPMLELFSTYFREGLLRLAGRSDIQAAGGTLPPAASEDATRLDFLRRQIKEVVPAGETVVLVDDGAYGDRIVQDRRALTFLERNGQYWGQPPDDSTAIRELERLRQSGATFIVFVRPALWWWLKHYSEFYRYLLSHYYCLMDDHRILVFDLRARRVGESVS